MKKIIIVAFAVIILIMVAVIIRGKSAPDSETEEIIPTPTIILPTISSDVQVELLPLSNNQAVALTIKKIPTDVKTIEYELTYTTGAGLPRGVLGKMTLKGEKEITRDDIVLGTCSSGRCVYDTGVTLINLTLKFNSSKGSSIFQKTYPL